MNGAVQFVLLLWKNFILQVRRPVGTAIELAIPPLAVVVLIGLKYGVFEVQDRCFVTFPSDPLTVPLPNNSYQIYYTPINNNTSRVAKCIEQKLPYYAEVNGVPTEADIVSALSDVAPPILLNGPQFEELNLPTNTPLGCFIRGAGIVFNNLESDNLEYTLRLRHEVGEDKSWETREAAPNFQAPGPRITDNFYLSEGFVHLESIVGEAIIRLMANPNMTDCDGVLEHNISVSMRQLPYPQYTVDFFLLTAVSILPFLIVLAFIYSAGTFTKELVLEKETRIRESMLMMGLKQWALWTTWFIKQFIFLSISSFFVALLLKLGGVFPASDFFLLFVFLILFNISTIAFCFFLSVWFNSARIGLLIGFLGWFVNYLPYIFVPGRYQILSLGAKLGFCILSNTCMGLGINTIALLEIRGEGVQWDNFYQDISLDDNFNLGYVFLMLIIDSLIYMFIAWYVNGVKPGQYGVPKPLYFPFQPSYWLGRPSANASLTQVLVGVGASPLAELDPSAHEDEPQGLSVGISVQYLTKIYDEGFLKKKQKQRNVAVDGLNLNMYEGQITALLGHNGAGKTTTISILTGLYTPTSGTAVINGYDIRSNMDQIRHSLGICPQHNVLFDRLTVLEHLKFFARLKGVHGKRVLSEVDHMIEDLQLQDKRNTPSQKLSGGMKRKLSAGIALIGGSKFVVLDEPTSGIDPYARRAIWDLLVRYKKGRTILLTTHSMDEADLLGDRIAIMAEGKLRCSGSSLFLKKRYGVGYRMVIVKEPSCDSAKVTDTVTSLVRGGKNVTDVGAELSYMLPLQSSQSFPTLFDTLEARKRELCIAGFGISITTMEEVFIKVGEGTDETLDERIKRTGTSTDIPVSRSQSPSLSVVNSIRPASSAQNEIHAEVLQQREFGDEKTVPQVTVKGRPADGTGVSLKPPTDFVPNSGAVLWFQQFYAMFLKRVYNSLRFWQAIITQLVLPLLFVLIAMILAVTLPNANENDPSRPLVISNSALDPDNRLVFFALFGDVPSNTLDFNSVTAESIGATELLNYTGDSMEMYQYVQDVESPSQCCNYSYQILDKFCARQAKEQFECKNTDLRNKFGYLRCLKCLNCCRDSSAVVPSCTNPLTQTSSSTQEDLCPRPPLVSLDDAESNATGRLDSETVFVDETLLRKGTNMAPEVYIRRVQAGFVLSYRDPPYAACGCSDSETFAQQYLSELSECIQTDGDQVYALKQDHKYFSWLSRVCDERGSGQSGSGMDGSSGGIGSGSMRFSKGYEVDGLSANLLQILACGNQSCDGETSNNRPVAKFFPTEIPQVSATVYYNNNPWHMSAAALNAFHNVWLRQATNNSDLRLTINNHPLPRTVDAEVDATQQNFNGFAIGTMVVFGFSFLISTFVLFPINEKEVKAKRLQFVSGVHVSSFWIATFAWDLLNALVPVILSVTIFAAFQVDGYAGDGLAGVFLLLLLTCWCTIPMVYSISFLFSNSLVAFAVIFFFLFITSQVFLLIQFFVTDQSIKDGLHYLTLFDPSYALSIGLNDLYLNNIVRDTCNQNNYTQRACKMSDTIRFVENPLSIDRPGVGVNLIYLALEGVFFFALTLLLENGFFFSNLRGVVLRYIQGRKTRPEATVEPLLLHGEDEDVAAERKRVMSEATSEEDTVIIKHLVKKYHRSLDGCTLRAEKLAVNRISLIVPQNECFGLLGVNGAGKTTTFSILTGDIAPSSGTAVVAGYDVRTDLRKVQQRIGYCPQFDALIERMTGRELLTMFARLRGIPESLISQAVEAEVARLDLTKHANKQCRKYSGGNKRKLSTAIALVGNPPIVFLDEPTTGMDPGTRRYLWDVLTGVTREGRSIILTSHSMEECEALCTRLAIMVNGQFKCLGSVQHLKNKYGSGFSLQAKMGPKQKVLNCPSDQQETAFSAASPLATLPAASSDPDFENSPTERNAQEGGFQPKGSGPEIDTTLLHNFIKESFPGAILLEEHQGSVTYQLPSAGLTWSSVFRQLEANKDRLGITDYSVSQTTLEQVFINFAREQEENIL